MRALLARLARERRGAVTILAALSMTASLGALALGVDTAAIYFESRRLQGMADAAALAAVGDLAKPATAAQAMVDATDWGSPVTATVVTGRYRPDPAIAAATRFDPAAPLTDRDAARVTLAADARLFFGIAALGRDSVRISRTATAARADYASFSIGSRLLAVEGGLANTLLSGLTGSQVRLTAMDYNALLDAQVDLFAFSEALQTELNLQAASFDDALATRIAAPRALEALAGSLDGQGTATAAAAVRALATAAAGAGDVQLDGLLDLGPLGAQDRAARGASAQVAAYDVARAVLEMAGGDRQVKLDLGVTIPGLSKVTAYLAVGERPANSPWLAVTDRGDTIIRTAQSRLYIDARIGGVAGLGEVRLPLYVELAEAEAKLSAISCAGGPAARSVTLDVRPAIGHASIADIALAKLHDHKLPLAEARANIVSLPLVTVSGQARVDLTAPVWKPVRFSADDIATGRVRTVSSDSLVQGIAGSLVKGIDLRVNVGPLGLGAGAISGLVGGVLATAAPLLDGLVNTLTGLLGIHLGQADTRVNGLRCGIPALVA